MQVTDLTKRLHRLTSTGGIFSTTSSATMPAAYVQRIAITIHFEQAMTMLAWQTEPNFPVLQWPDVVSLGATCRQVAEKMRL